MAALVEGYRRTWKWYPIPWTVILHYSLLDDMYDFERLHPQPNALWDFWGIPRHWGITHEQDQEEDDPGPPGLAVSESDGEGNDGGDLWANIFLHEIPEWDWWVMLHGG